MDDYYTATVLDAMSLVDRLAQAADDEGGAAIPLCGGVELYVGASGYYPAPLEPFFCAPFCDTLQ